MDEFISKQDAVDVVEYANGNMTWAERDDCKKRLEELPPADVSPVVHGKWLPIVSYNNTYKCSECGRLLVNIADGLKKVAKHYPYCHCGAKMDGKREE